MIKNVISRVDLAGAVFRDVCYEWENEIAKDLGVPVVGFLWGTANFPFSAALKKTIRTVKDAVKWAFPFIIPTVRHLRKKNASLMQLEQNLSEPLSLHFVMLLQEYTACIKANCLPIFLDVWIAGNGIDNVAYITKNLKYFYVTSRDVFNRILEKHPESRVRYMPLSVSNIYYSYNFERYRNKTIDVIQVGRANYVLHEYMLKYAAEHKNINYVYSDTGRSAGSYISTLRGSIGTVLDRKNFINMLASAKVSLVSSPGFENSKDYARDIHFVTPRFYESAILGCALIGRYPDNQEFRELNINRYCPNITSYEQFAECLERALAQTPEELYAQNHDFIINSLTSKRAEQIQRDLAELTGE